MQSYSFWPDLLRFLVAFISHWQGYVTGGAVTALIFVVERLWGKQLSRKMFAAIFIVTFSLVAFFMAWRDEYTRANQLDRQYIEAQSKIINLEKDNGRLEKDNRDKDASLSVLQSENLGLKNKLGEKPAVITRTVQVPTSGQPIDEAEQRRREQERKKHLEIRTTLSVFLARGNNVRNLCLTKPPIPTFKCQDTIGQLIGETILYLDKNLEPSYRVRFESASGLYLSYDNAATPQDNNYVNILKFKIDILEQFIREFKD